MRKALIIIAAVTAYSLLETGLLLSSAFCRSSVSTAPSAYQSVVYLGQFLLIPGIAALFSRFIYGPHQFGRRTLVILLAGPLGLCLLITPFAGLAIFLDWTFIVSKILFAVALTAVMVALVLAVRWCIRKSRRWSLQAEEVRWLADRKSGADPVRRKWRNRGIRFALCIPSTAVLLVFLFLPEIWGVFSHLSQPRSGNLPGYEVSIPVTWIVLRHENQTDGRSWVTGMAGCCMVRNDPLFDSQSDLTFSGWDIETEPYIESDESMRTRWTPEDKDVISQRVFTIGSDQLTCFDYRSSYLHYGDFSEPSAASVRCSDGKRLSASFSGKRSKIAAFYEMLSGITPKK